MMKNEEVIKTFAESALDYAYDDNIFSEEPTKVAASKWALARIPAVDRIIIILYAELGSYRKVAKKMGVSHNTIRLEVMRIREEIYNLIRQYRE